MALRATISSLDDVPEEHRGLYVQVGDEYVVDLDDGEYKKRITEFRDNNITLKKRVDTLAAESKQLAELKTQLEKYDGLDAEKAREALQKIQAIEDKKLMDAGQIDELLSQRTERMRLDYDGQVKAALKARDDNKVEADKYRELYQKEVIDNKLSASITSIGKLRPGAIRDALWRGREVWKLNDQGIPTPFSPDGKVIYGKDGENPISMDEWAQSLMQEVPYLWEGNVGGGAGGAGGGAGGGTGQVDRMDQNAINSNIEGIARGEVVISN